MSTPARRASSSAGSAKSASLHDSARGSPEPQPSLDAFGRLVETIENILGTGERIRSEEVDVVALQEAMEAYTSDESEWSQYAFADPQQKYTRNLVSAGNRLGNLLILVWTPGQPSPVHDHANAHCVMKILKGALTETLYGYPCEVESTSTTDALGPGTDHKCCQKCSGPTRSTSELPVKRETTYSMNQVTYMSDRLGLHSVGNPSTDPKDYAVSLHLYTPPNAATFGCSTFDPKTGKKSPEKHKMNHFYSELGVKM